MSVEQPLILQSCREMTEQLRYWVWLAMVFDSDSALALHLLKWYDDIRSAYEGVMSGECPRLPQVIRRSIAKHSIEEADSIVHYCQSNDIMLFPINCAEYPSVLCEITSPPVLLTAKGNPALLNSRPCITAVGARRPSPYSEQVADAVVRGACEANGYIIASGFARGIDAAAHTAAMNAGSGTIAVLGCGINVNYPRENSELRSRMLSEGNGLLISEFMPGVPPNRPNFPRRNRILSGLSHLTFVIEASMRSGSLVTVQCAAAQGRNVCAVPPADVFSERYAGNGMLLRDGAWPVMNAEDLIAAAESDAATSYASVGQRIRLMQQAMFRDRSGFCSPINMVMMMQRAEAQLRASEHPEARPDQQTEQPHDSGRQQRAAGPVRAAESAKTSPAAEMQGALPETEEGRAVYAYLREHGDTYADDIAAALDLELSVLLQTLTELELDGFAESLFGKQYRACER